MISEIFTTLRVLPGPSESLERSRVPLYERHVGRLRDGHAHFVGLEDGPPLDWDAEVHRTLEDGLKRQGLQFNDLRMKLVATLTSPPVFRVDACVALPGAAPFHLSPASAAPSGSSRPRVLLSPRFLELDQDELDQLLYKTTDRSIYERHDDLAREAFSSSCGSFQSTLLHLPPSQVLTETTIANILFLPPDSAMWITPRLSSSSPLLPGLMRADLLARGLVHEREIKLDEAAAWLEQGGRMACCNALRGVWDVDLAHL